MSTSTFNDDVEPSKSPHSASPNMLSKTLKGQDFDDLVAANVCLSPAAKSSDLRRKNLNEMLLRERHPIQLAANEGHSMTATPFGMRIKQTVVDVNNTKILTSEAKLPNSESEPGLHSVCSSGDKEQAAELLKKGADINLRDNNLKTALHVACICGQTEMSLFLIDMGADIHAKEIEQKTAMHFACSNGLMDVVMSLVDRGANIDVLDKGDRTPLNDACRYGYINIAVALVERSADTDTVSSINCKQNKNKLKDQKICLMHESIGRGDLEMFKDLLESCSKRKTDIKVNTKNTTGWTFLISSCIYQRYNIAEYLIREKHADLTLKDGKGMSALHYACDKKNVELVNLLLQNGAPINAYDDNNSTPLHWACDSKTPDMAMMLINHGAEIDVKDSSQKTPLHWAVDRGHIDLAKELLVKGADVHATDRRRWTPLHWGCTRGNVELVEMLAKSGANLNSQEIQNKTPLMLAIDNQSIEIVNFLLEHDADIYIQDNRTLYALHYAAQYGYNDIVEAIILKGGTRVVQVVDYVNCTPIHWACLYGQTKTIDILLDHGADINATTYYKRTPISFACERGFMDTVQFLVERGANVNIKDDRGLLPDCCEDTLETFRRLWYGNPLMRAMFDEDLNEFIQLLSNCDEETANQEIGDGHGWTVLHAAVYLDRVDFVDHMVKCDKIQMKNTHMPRMLSAMHIACGKNNSRMIKILADRLNREAV